MKRENHELLNAFRPRPGSRMTPSEVERVINGIAARTNPRSHGIREGRGRIERLAIPSAVASH